MGNRETEQAAITHVMALERAAGRDPKDVHASGLPYDIDSSPRMIEVKAFSRSARSEPLPLEDRQVTAAKENRERTGPPSRPLSTTRPSAWAECCGTATAGTVSTASTPDT
ncbi:protein NO VEIN domain-containing protein [Streptomyces umbrinus]|uniref:protein NO VEIN domain-containing protein n=1 Tax=Streptomyces umbrinus TaxID=67370 RepID=UPI003C2BA604